MIKIIGRLIVYFIVFSSIPTKKVDQPGIYVAYCSCKTLNSYWGYVGKYVLKILKSAKKIPSYNSVCRVVYAMKLQ